MRSGSAAVVVMAGVLVATPALACFPPPRDTAGEIAGAQGAFVAEVTAVRRLPQRACERELRSEGIRRGDPGWSACAAYGVAELRPLQTVRGEGALPDAPLASWTAQPYCYLGWQPQVGERVLALVLAPNLRLENGANVYVDPFDQQDDYARGLIARVP